MDELFIDVFSSMKGISSELKKITKNNGIVDLSIFEKKLDRSLLDPNFNLYNVIFNDTQNNIYHKVKLLNYEENEIPLRETMIEGSNDGYTPMSWSPNKYNRLYANACPVGEELKDSFKNIQIYTLKYSHDLNQITDEKERMKREGIQLEIQEARNIGRNRTKITPLEEKEEELRKSLLNLGYGHCWFMDRINCNLLLNHTKGLQFPLNTQDSLLEGFENVMFCGPLCEEPCVGIQYNLRDATINCEKKGIGRNELRCDRAQLITMARRSCKGAMLLGKMTIMVPILSVKMTIPENYLQNISSFLKKHYNIEIINDKILNDKVIKISMFDLLSFKEYINSTNTNNDIKFDYFVFDSWNILNDPKKDLYIGQSSDFNPVYRNHKIILDRRKFNGFTEKTVQGLIEEYTDKP